MCPNIRAKLLPAGNKHSLTVKMLTRNVKMCKHLLMFMVDSNCHTLYGLAQLLKKD